MPGINTWVNLGLRNAAFRKGLRQAEKDFNGLGKRIGGSFARTLGAGVGAGSIAKIASDLADIANVSDRLGLSAEFLQELQFGFRETGIEVSQGNVAIQRFIRRVAEAREGTGEAQAALKELGVEFVNADGSLKSNERLLRDTADALDGVEDRSTRVRLAFKLFDSEGVKLLTTLKGGSAALDDFASRARAANAVVSDEAVEGARELDATIQQALSTLKGATGNLLGGFVNLWQGAVTGATNAFIELKILFTEGSSALRRFQEEQSRSEELERKREVQAKARAEEAKAAADLAQTQAAAAVRNSERQLELDRQAQRLERARAEIARGNVSAQEKLREAERERYRLTVALNEASDLAARSKLTDGLIAQEEKLAKIKKSIAEEEANALLLERERLANLGDERAQLVATLQGLRAGSALPVTDLERIGGGFRGVNTAALSITNNEEIRLAREQLNRLDRLVENTDDLGAGGDVIPFAETPAG